MPMPPGQTAARSSRRPVGRQCSMLISSQVVASIHGRTRVDADCGLRRLGVGELGRRKRRRSGALSGISACSSCSGGKLTVQYVKKTSHGPRCGDCKGPLPGVSE